MINGDHRHSDHRPVVVVTDEEITHQVRSGQPSFRFEAGWIKEELCEPIVENAWKLSMNVRGGKVENVVPDVAADLWDWNCNVLGDLEKRIKKAKRALESCRHDQLNARNVTTEHVLKYRLEKLEDQKDLYWRQRAHVLWLENGDCNSKFFHQFASERRRRNKIKRLVTEEGGVGTDEGEMRVLVANYYNNLFESHAGDRIDELLQHVPVKVSEEANRTLCKEVTSEEIKEALDGIGDLKAPGSDGMPALFYKQFWHIVGDDIIREVKAFLEGGDMPSGWNETVVVLIPKVQCPEKLKDLRPISLCTVVYKIISKVLSNRLKTILADIISPNQSAFVLGRLITDNILLAYELTHFIQNKRSSKEGFAAIKLDMSKAYDRVEWDFLRRMMLKMGFAEIWVNTAMRCVTSVSYKVKLNGDLTEEITPERGLRQGDPISPYLFLICVEGFSSLLHAAETRGDLEGVKVYVDAPSINHLLFADDSLLLLKTNERSANHLQNVLNLYENCSGQTINEDKSSVMFSKNTNERDRQ